jgi:hypothetical protein
LNFLFYYFIYIYIYIYIFARIEKRKEQKSTNSSNLEEIVRIRIKTKGIDMKESSHDLSIHWKTIHELTRLAVKEIKDFDKGLSGNETLKNWCFDIINKQ